MPRPISPRREEGAERISSDGRPCYGRANGRVGVTGGEVRDGLESSRTPRPDLALTNPVLASKK